MSRWRNQYAYDEKDKEPTIWQTLEFKIPDGGQSDCEWCDSRPVVNCVSSKYSNYGNLEPVFASGTAVQ